MIQAVGVVYFNYKINNISKYSNYIQTKINKLKNKYKDKFEIIAISEPFADGENQLVRVSCSFQIYMFENFYRQSIDDYVGQVFPTLKERLPVKVISTQVHHLSKVSDNRKKRSKSR
ncbi:MAG: hypothetical protein ABF649_19305 [Bacillus sp. (in: firmicutes)]